MEDSAYTNDLLNIRIGITASPVVDVEKQIPGTDPSQDLPFAANAGPFSTLLDLALQYNSFSRILNLLLGGKRIDLSEGIFAQHIVIRQVIVSGNAEGNLLLRVDFSGSFKGVVYFTAKPAYNEITKVLELQNLRYNLQTNNLLLKGAKFLFASRIETELNKATSLSIAQYLETAQVSLTEYLNREWTNGLSGSGEVKNLHLTSVQALPEHLLIQVNCNGFLKITIAESLLNFNR